MYKPGQFLYQAAKEHKETGQIGRRNIVGGLVELIGGTSMAGTATFSPKPAQAFERNPDGYPVPDLTGLRPYQTLNWDVEDTIPGKETLIERYRLNDGAKVARLSINGNTFAYTVRDAQSKTTYGYVDSSGTGKYTERYGHDEVFSVPDWLVKKTLSQSKGMNISKR